MAGTFPHAVLVTRPVVAGQGFAIVDMRRVLRPPIAPFITITVPSIITQAHVVEQLGSVAAHMRAPASFFVDGELLGSGTSIVSMACTITLFGYNAFPFPDHASPAVLDTVDALSNRGGFRSFFFRSRGGSTSTSTTPSPIVREAANSSEARAAPPDSSPNTGFATNSDLLDFVHDEHAISRIDAAQRLGAYTLFDSVLQTRLAAKEANWNYVDCLEDARRHFAHLGPDPELRFLRDAVEGLPTPQVVATPRAVCHRAAAFPLDVRPAGRGICVLDVPHTATPFNVAFHAVGACQMFGLHQQIARRNCVMRGRGQDLPPFDTLDRIDSASVWFSEDIPRMSLASQFLVQESAREALREARDLQHSFFEHAEAVPIMLHVPEHPPLQVFIPKECSSELLHYLASGALTPFEPHQQIRLHLPGGVPRGTDCMLHFVAELDNSLQGDRTFYLVDGRPLEPDGPPFRTLNLPSRLTLGELFGLIRQAFVDAAPAAFIRVNRCLLHRLTLQRFRLPILRPLQLGSLNELPTERDDSLIPSVDLLEGFPGLWASHFGSATTTSTTTGPLPDLSAMMDPTTTTTTTPEVWVRSLLFPAHFTFQEGNCFPCCLQLPVQFPEQRIDEVVIHSFGWGTFRVQVPRPTTASAVELLVARALNLPRVDICWPPFAPCSPGQPIHLVLWPSDLPPDGTVAVVDARRVGALVDPPFWLCVLPEDSTASSVVVDAICGRQLCITPTGVRVDGFCPSASFQPRPGVRVVTLLSGAAREQFCVAVNGDPFSRFPGTRSFPLTRLRTSTTTTTRPHAGPPAPILQSHWPLQNVTCAPYEWRPIIVAVLEQLVLPACLQHPAYTVGSIVTCQRVFHGRDGEALVYCAFESHDPFSRNAWVDIRLEPRSLHMMALECYVTCAQILERAGVTTRFTPLLFVDGVRCHDGIHVRDGSVITICRRKTQAVSDSLGRVATRYPVLQCLIRQLDLPHSLQAVVECSPVDSSHVMAFRTGLRCAIEYNIRVLGLVPEQSRAIIASVAYGAFPVGCGSGIPADVEAIDARAHEIWFALNINRITDTKQVLNDCCVYLARESRSTEIFWFLVDQPCPDVFALARDIDPALGIPCPEGTAVDVVRRGPGWGIFRIVPAGMELRNRGSTDQLDVNDLSSLDSQQTERFFAVQRETESVSSGLSAAEALPVSDAEPDDGSSLLQKSVEVLKGRARHDDPSTVISRFRNLPTPCRGIRRASCRMTTMGETTLPVLADASSGAQAVRLGCPDTLASPALEHPAVDNTTNTREVQIWVLGSGPVSLTIASDCQLAEVESTLAHAVPQLGPAYVVPIFPPSTPVFHCLAFPRALDPRLTVILLHKSGQQPQAITVWPTENSSDLSTRLELPEGLFQVDGCTWNGPASGCYHGMRVTWRSVATAAHPLQLSHLLDFTAADTRVQARTERKLCVGACLEDLLDLLDPLRVVNLCRVLPATDCLHHDTLTAVAQLSPWSAATPLCRVSLFVDGSYTDSECLAGWAVVAIGHLECGNCLLGFAAGPTGAGRHSKCLSDGPPSAHLAELDALAFALGIAASSDGVEYTVYYDCVSAAGVATLDFTAHAHTEYAPRLAALRILADQRRNHVAFEHVRSHTGNPFNELADVLAKEAARGCRRWSADPRAFVDAFCSGSICHQWWTVTDLVPQGCLPGLDDDGNTIPGVPESAPPSCLDGRIPGVPLGVAPAVPGPDSCKTWNLVVATYNVTSLCNVAEEQCVDTCLHRSGVVLAGLQEARRFPGERSSTEHYTRFSSKGDNGNFGCQLWISRTLFPITDLGKDGCFCPDKAVIVHSAPRLLAATIPAGGLTFGVIVCHALTSAATPEAREDWWHHVDAVIRQLPRHAIPLLLVDANARFTADQASPTMAGAVPNNHNAHCLLPLLAEHGLDSTPLFDGQGDRIVTWVAPSGHSSQLDYVLAPSEMAACATSIGVPLGFVDHNGFDHSPMVAKLEWCAPATATKRPPRFDTTAMRSSAGRATLEAIFHNAPPIAWTTHPDAHVQQLNEYLYGQLSKHFPARTARPRTQHISDEQWDVIRCRRHARRLLQRNKHLKERIFLAKMLAQWKASCSDTRGHSDVPRYGAQERRVSHTAARLGLAIRGLSKSLRTLSRRDAADHTRRSLAEARATGPAALASLLRGVMKSGRRYRAPRVQHVVEENGVELADIDAIQAAQERHFAQPEHGCPTAVPALISSSFPNASEPPLVLAELPSVSDLAVGLQRLKQCKAPGASAIPAEALSQAPLAAAMTIFPLFLKGATRQQVPLLWRGTQAIPLLKPAKPPHALASWRNIALFDCCAKGIGAAIRSQLCGALQRVGAKGQHGALRHSAIGVPSHYVQGYIRLARVQRRSGAVVFLDGKSAYYSIIRQHLFPLREQDDHSVLQGLLASLAHDSQQQDAIIAAMAGPGLLAQGGAPAALIEYLRDSLDNSWFALNVEKGTVQRTATGSVPGTPTADVLFQFLQSVFMKNLTARLQQAGLLARYSDSGEGCPQPAWADDVAVLAPLCSAGDVIPAVSRIVHAAEAESRAGGIELNFSAGKTEAIAIFRGSGSKLQRRCHLTEAVPSVQVALASGRSATVRIVDSYVHLGCLVHYSGSCLADIRAKTAAANIVFRRLKTTLLKNKHLEVHERTLLVRSLVHSKLGFGAGLWVLSCRAEREAFQHAFMVHWRQACAVLLGVGCKFLSDTEVCTLLQVAEPEVVYQAAKLRQLRDVLRHGPGSLWQSINMERSWLDHAIEALASVGHCLQLSLPRYDHTTELEMLLPLEPCLSSWASRYTKACVACNDGCQEDILRKAKGLAVLERSGGLQLKVPQVAACTLWQCHLCHRVCSTKAALAVHHSIVHGFKASSHYAGGDTCQVCGVH